MNEFRATIEKRKCELIKFLMDEDIFDFYPYLDSPKKFDEVLQNLIIIYSESLRADLTDNHSAAKLGYLQLLSTLK